MAEASESVLAVAHTAYHQFAHGLATQDWEGFLGMLSDDFTFWFPSGPFKGLNHGKEKMQEFFHLVDRCFEKSLSLSIERVTSSENTVVFEVRSQGMMMGHPYENQAAVSLDVKGDQICAYREYMGVVYQLGER